MDEHRIFLAAHLAKRLASTPTRYLSLHIATAEEAAAATAAYLASTRGSMHFDVGEYPAPSITGPVAQQRQTPIHNPGRVHDHTLSITQADTRPIKQDKKFLSYLSIKCSH